MEILSIAVTGALCIVCFFIGAKVGQAASKGEEIKIELPEVNPMKLYRDHQERKAADREQKKLDALMHNIEVYDGTSAGQKDIPR